MKKILLTALVLSVAGFSAADLSLAYSAEKQVFIRGIRTLGMGGAFTAVADDANAIFYNPAGITQRQGSQFTLFDIPVNVSDDIFNVYTFYQDNEDNFKNFDDLSQDKKMTFLNEISDKMVTYRPNFKVGFPNLSYLTGRSFLSWGLGLFTQADMGFQFNRSMIIPSISMWGNVDAVGAVPLAHKFESLPYVPGSLSAGMTLKYIQRGKVEELNKSFLTFNDFEPDPQMGSGFGFDLGALYQFNPRWNFGLQVTDVGGTNISYSSLDISADDEGKVAKPAFNSMINSQWNVGAAYVPSKITYWPGKSIRTNDRLILAADVRDVMSTDERLVDATFYKKLHLGAEFRWGPASLRGGFNSGYPTFGAGIRIPYLGLKVDYAFYGDELGRYAGQQPSWNHQLNLALSWGDTKGRAYGSDAADKNVRLAKAKE